MRVRGRWVRTAIVVAAWAALVIGWLLSAFIVVSLARPLVLFPATLVTVAAGMLFGPVAGVVVAAAGANGSALVSFHLARSIGAVERADATTAVARWATRPRRSLRQCS